MLVGVKGLSHGGWDDGRGRDCSRHAYNHEGGNDETHVGALEAARVCSAVVVL